ncbi:chaplin [Streptomyces sp. Ru73]|uniref:chaplin n=1 Tax=Streptomyces sp. Ru73 TaxID=2080748 RepID=UPI000CDD2636|nr:chaplin [Streptomyces sp. Ru73]POX37216.1 chaplin [Streptomyces sp. Ru73]
MRIRITAAAAVLATAAIVGGAGAAAADSGAQGSSSHSPGVVSGNTIQVPVHVPVNACGLSVDVIGLLNPAHGQCANK